MTDMAVREIPQAQLDQWRLFFEHLHGMAREAQEALGYGDAARVRDLLRDIEDHATQIAFAMERHGAQTPSSAAP
jgi:hypothetical protein